MRKPIVAGNWKMHFTADEASAVADQIRTELVDQNYTCDVVLCPTFTSLSSVKNALVGTEIGLGAQNMHWEGSGAYTGDVSAEMILTSGCQYVILGHSERRQYAFESDEDVKRKVVAALHSGLTPIVCVGETLEQREKGDFFTVIEEQLSKGLEDLTKVLASEIVIAYEPVWAIGTGKVATPAQVEEVHEKIRNFLKKTFSDEVGDSVRILYGGSVKPSNSQEILALPNVDGALVGGASLKAPDFINIIKSLPSK